MLRCRALKVIIAIVASFAVVSWAEAGRNTVQIFITNAPFINEWSILISYPPDALSYIEGSFEPGDFPGRIDPYEDNLGSTLLVGGVTPEPNQSVSGDGLLGTLVFDLTPTLKNGRAVVESVSLRADDQVRLTSSLSLPIELTVPAFEADFDANGSVDILDFYLFSYQFGTRVSRYDLDNSGRVDYLDLFRLADEIVGSMKGTIVDVTIPGAVFSAGGSVGEVALIGRIGGHKEVEVIGAVINEVELKQVEIIGTIKKD